MVDGYDPDYRLLTNGENGIPGDEQFNGEKWVEWHSREYYLKCTCVFDEEYDFPVRRRIKSYIDFPV